VSSCQTRESPYKLRSTLVRAGSSGDGSGANTPNATPSLMPPRGERKMQINGYYARAGFGRPGFLPGIRTRLIPHEYILHVIPHGVPAREYLVHSREEINDGSPSGKLIESAMHSLVQCSSAIGQGRRIPMRPLVFALYPRNSSAFARHNARAREQRAPAATR